MSELNITPETILDIVIGIIILAGILISKSRPQSRRIISFNYMMLSWFFLAMIFIFEAISVIYLDLYLNILSNLFSFYSVFALLIGFNYMKKENFNSPLLLCLIIYGTLYHVAAFLPGSVAKILEDGYLTINWFGPFAFLGILLYVIFGYLLIYWGVKTWRNAPFELKKETAWFLSITIFAGISCSIGMVLSAWIPAFIFVVDCMLLFALFVFLYLGTVQPKIFYILPFSIYRINVLDSRGNILFTFDWAKTDFKYSFFAKYINMLQKFSNELIRSGGVVDLNLQGCQIIVFESQYTTTILFTSKSSRVLRNSLLSFSRKFEETFSSLLKDSVTDPVKYHPANKLLQEYFNNFPSRMILDKKQRFFISKLEQNLSEGTNSRIKQIFRDEAEYEMVREEMEKVPKCLPDSFVKLFDELEKETEDNLEKTEKDKEIA